MAEVHILCLNDNKLDIKEMDSDSVMSMLECYHSDEYAVLTFDIGSSIIYVNKQNIVWIEVD